MSKSSSFEKFINPKISGAKKKEAIRQEKKKVKAELRGKEEIERKQNEAKYGLVTKESKNQEPRIKIQDSRDKPQAASRKPQGESYRKQEIGFKEQGTRSKPQDTRFRKEVAGDKRENKSSVYKRSCFAKRSCAKTVSKSARRG